MRNSLNNKAWQGPAAMILLVVFGLASANAQQTTTLLENGRFSDKLSSGAPKGWSVVIGASNGGKQPVSNVSVVEGVGLELSGDRRTKAWNLVQQSVLAKPEQVFRLKFRARGKGLKREANQFDNCHVGLWFKDADGKLLSNNIVTVNSSQFKDYVLTAAAPQRSAGVDVVAFLSKTGTLNVESMELTDLSKQSSFDFLLDELDKNYSYLDHKGIDLKKLESRFEARAQAAANSPEEFVEVAAELLAELKDVHAWVKKNGKPYSKFQSMFEPNYNFTVVDKRLSKSVEVGRFAKFGLTRDGFGYVRVTTLAGVDREALSQIKTRIRQLSKARGMIVDLRRNSGGDERVAREIASLFADQDYVYAKHKFREGGGWAEVSDRVLPGGGSDVFTKPMVCLIGPGAVSSGEAFALMFQSLKHCETAGLPTRGASGNPAPVVLPNGVEVWFSRWFAMDAQGKPIEDRGVQPDVTVERPADKKLDPTYEKAVQMLRSKTNE